MTATVYGYQDAVGSVLYVGCTERPAERVSSGHRRKPWWADVAQAVIFVTGVSIDVARHVERSLIEALEPAGNYVYTSAWREKFGAEPVSITRPCTKAEVERIVAAYKAPPLAIPAAREQASA